VTVYSIIWISMPLYTLFYCLTLNFTIKINDGDAGDLHCLLLLATADRNYPTLSWQSHTMLQVSPAR